FTEHHFDANQGLEHKRTSCLAAHNMEDSWEIVEGLRGGQCTVQDPQKQEGFMMKKRKWPMKGWHKRYFFLDKGILKYAKCAADIDKGKLHGRIDVGLSVMAIKKKAKCIDLDAEENIYHLKVKSQELFDEWVSKLRHHRLFRQNEITMYPLYSSTSLPTVSENASMRKVWSSLWTEYSLVQTDLSSDVTEKREAGFGSFGHNIPNNLCLSLSLSSELSSCEAQLLELSHLLQSMEVLHRTYSAPAITALQVRYYTHNIKHAHTIVPSCISAGPIRLHASNPNLSSMDLTNEKNYSEAPDSPGDVAKLQEDFCHVANKLHGTMKSALDFLLLERERLKQVLDHEPCQTPSAQMLGLKNALSSAIAQNTELRERLCRIHAESSLIEPSLLVNLSPDSTDGSRPLVHQISNESRASITESLSEFFDAQEVLLSASSSENEGDSYISDISDNISMDNLSTEVENERLNSGGRRRRSCLPSPSPNTNNISLWNILKNNIGKDLSKVAMPVQLNEPLNTLQRLCEELEYSELLDRAANTADPYERMVYIATFAVSGYASSYHRAGGKPFNPVLGETYECDRPDKGFRFVAEQVSHHPPISACHAESKNFIFRQDMRWKNKFWGKSMEIVPIGTSHVVLPGFGDHYEWNKVTSCIHNILSGQRWIEHYGEISIKNSNSDACQCKVTFIKAKYWNSSVNEVQGTVLDQKGNIVHTLFGKWHEAMFCGDPPSANCVWRANSVPQNHEQYYGFTKFAIELNELKPEMKQLLPPTDTRLRPDQRLLEEGNVEGAEEQKQHIEQLQRDRRRVLEENNMIHQPRFFQKSQNDMWVSNNTYWDLRKEPGFSHLDCPVLW
uniref:Oxysterol-binding protein n=1 Tax=Denticeps clupeoides TaxID=299321 RepID=A0AAY4A5A0_9TELE